MNFLAHIYLSGENDDIKIGNFLGDFVKGRLNKLTNTQFSDGIIKGLSLHREIDFFTDNHPIVRKSIDRLQPKYHKFSGIVVDMFYDHILAKNFHQYSLISLEDYANNFYDLLQKRKLEIPQPVERMVNSMVDMFYDHILAKNFHQYSLISLEDYAKNFYDLLENRKLEIPQPMERMVNSMVVRNWFVGYKSYAGIEWALTGISKRLSFESGIENAVEELRNDFKLYEAEFQLFFPEIIAHTQNFLNR